MTTRLLGMTLFLVGCSEPLEGEWEGDEIQCSLTERDRAEFVVDDELHASGEVCSCEFDFVAEDRGDGRYRLDIDFDGVCFRDDGKYDCELKRDDEQLDCDELGDFDKVND